MSASLVGSEMCIRDRAMGATSVVPGSGTRFVLLGVGADVQRPQRQCLLAVSYTHLTLPTICSV
eukprot:14007088-Alexandrium_andersonii.AAC.1